MTIDTGSIVDLGRYSVEVQCEEEQDDPNHMDQMTMVSVFHVSLLSRQFYLDGETDGTDYT
jgi:hypothetical protein